MVKVKYSFDNAMQAMGLNASSHDTPKTLKAQALKTVRRYVWRNYRAFLAVNKQGWFSLSTRKRDTTGVNRYIFDKGHALGPIMWAAMDNAQRNKRGVYA